MSDHNDHPLVAGGQGRDDREVDQAGDLLGWLAVSILLLIAAFSAARWLA